MKEKIKKKQVQGFLNENSLYEYDKISKKLPKSSFVFVTRNRCPYKDFEKNPLTWAFESLINNKIYKVDDWVVIDDASIDYTFQNIKWLQKEKNIKINYYKNKQRKGCSYSRNIGLKKTKNNYVFMGDDDCLYKQFFLFISMLSFIHLQKKDKKITILNLPVYEKSFYPSFWVEEKEIGRVFFDKTWFFHNFDCLPINFLHKNNFIDKFNKITKPIKVQTFKGVNLCDKDKILKIGGYPDLSMWSNDYSEHIELTKKILDNNLSIYHQFDPKSGCIHLKYGAKTKDRAKTFDRNFYFNSINYSFGELVKMSEKNKKKTGCRCTDKIFHLNEIGTLFSFYLKISKKLGVKFAKKEYINFVNKNKIFSSSPYKKIKNKKERQKIWLQAIKKGCMVSGSQSDCEYDDVLKQLFLWQKEIR